MSGRVAFFLPTRKGSERVRNKNTRPFAGIDGGLVENKLRQLTATRRVDEIILSSNDEETMRIARPFARRDARLRIVERPEALCLATTDLRDVIRYVPTLTDAEHILWGHVTTPMAGAEVYDAAVDRYLKALDEGYDSLVGVSELRNFLLDAEGRVANNRTPLRWPRTQDLDPLFEINHTVFLAPRTVYLRDGDRLGRHPFLQRMDRIVGLDIDWEEDFLLAEAVFSQMQQR